MRLVYSLWLLSLSLQELREYLSGNCGNTDMNTPSQQLTLMRFRIIVVILIVLAVVSIRIVLVTQTSRPCFLMVCSRMVFVLEMKNYRNPCKCVEGDKRTGTTRKNACDRETMMKIRAVTTFATAQAALATQHASRRPANTEVQVVNSSFLLGICCFDEAKNGMSLARNIACFATNMAVAHQHFLDLSSQTSVFRQMVLSSPENMVLPRVSFAGSGLIRHCTEKMQIVARMVEN